MKIQLIFDCYVGKTGAILDVVRVIPHGGYTDDSHQYVVMHNGKEACVRSGLAKEFE